MVKVRVKFRAKVRGLELGLGWDGVRVRQGLEIGLWFNWG
jgi:hypothetical protein